MYHFWCFISYQVVICCQLIFPKFHRLKPRLTFRIFWPSQLLFAITLINFLAEFVSGGHFEDALLQSLLPVFVLLAKPESTVLIPAALLINLILARLIRLFGPIKAVHLVPIYLTFGSVTYFHMVRLFYLLPRTNSPQFKSSLFLTSHIYFNITFWGPVGEESACASDRFWMLAILMD